MTRWDRLPPSFQVAVRETPQPNFVEVFRSAKGRMQNSGRTVEVAPFTEENLNKADQIIAKLRTQKNPNIQYITNQFIDVHRSSGRSHVDGAIQTNAEAQGDPFDLYTAGRQALADKAANCDRANAAAACMTSQFDIKDPVLFYWTTENNHNAALIGDPRMAKYGDENTVVLDAHAIFPMAHTLAEAAFQIIPPREGEEGYEDVETLRFDAKPFPRLDASPLPAPITARQRAAWLNDRGWPTRFGADVVQAWHDTELRENGAAPDRWQYLFSCKDPSVRYASNKGDGNAYNRFSLDFTRQRIEALLQMEKAYPEGTDAEHDLDALLPGSPGANDTEIAQASPQPSVPTGEVRPRPETGLAFQHVSPLHTIVTDLHTGEVLMEMRGSQVPVDKVNHGFPLKNPQNPYTIDAEYVSLEDRFSCHRNVKIGRVELPAETCAIMQHYFPHEAAEPGYFDKRAAEIKAEYEAPLNGDLPPSAIRWRPKRLNAKECYSTAQATALAGSFGVVPVDYNEQNVGRMGPAFAGALIKTAAQRRQYIAQTNKAAFDDFSMRAGDPRKPAEVARFAPYGGGNLAQFMNGKATADDPVHFVAVDVVVHTVNKYGEPRRVVAPHFFQVAEVPKGKQAILDYGDGAYFYDGNRPGMSTGVQQTIKTEPADDDAMQLDTPALPMSPRGGKRPAAPDITPQAAKRQLRSAVPTLGRMTRSSAGAVLAQPSLGQSSGTATRSVPRGGGDYPTQPAVSTATRHMQNLNINEGLDDDASSLSSLSSFDPDETLEGSDDDAYAPTHAGASSRARPAPGHNKTANEKIIERFPPDIWETAQQRAQVPGRIAGVTYQSATSQAGARYYVTRKIAGESTPLGSFSVTGGREDVLARAMAIATLMVNEAAQGAIRTRDDASVIAAFPPDIWATAQQRAKDPKRFTGVALQNMENTASSAYPYYKAYISHEGQQRILDNFSVTSKRSDVKARAMAIATRMVAEAEEGLVAADAAKIDQLPPDIWVAAQARASQPARFSGVTWHPPTDKRKSGQYRIHLQKKSLGAISVVEGRDDAKARALAIATYMVAERASGVKTKTDAGLIESFGPELWQRAQKRAGEPGLPSGVSPSGGSGGTSARYIAGMKIGGKQKSLGSFSVNADRDELTAKALAIATRWAAE